MIKRIKTKIRRIGILKNRKKLCEHFGLVGTTFKTDGSDSFEKAMFDCFGSNNEISLCGNVNLTTSLIYIQGNNNKIIIQKNCYLSNLTLWIEGDNNTVVIGKGCYMNNNTNITCTEGHCLIIGNACLFSTDINIQVGDGHPIFNEAGVRTNETKDITIGDNVWIGKRATLLKGSKIPNGCIVATGAIITKEFDKENCVIAGIPGKIVKENAFWSKKI